MPSAFEQLECLPPALRAGESQEPHSPVEARASTSSGGGGRRKSGRRGGGGGGDDESPITDGDLAEETRKKYLTYALSVITARAIPDVRDGLKPVARRILYTMEHEQQLRHDAKPRKSATVVGDVIGKYHPHGDGAVYDAMVRLAQDFVMRAPLVDGQGNFGSIDGDPAAAYRYTEARLTKVAAELLSELGKDTVDYRDNFDGRRREPIVLPARFPQLLVNGGTGIAVGMATSIPPHNLGEVVKAAIALIDDPNLTVRKLLKYIKGPDFPTGGELVASHDDLASAYETGKGSLKLRGRWKYIEDGRDPKIVITEVPYGIEKAALVEEIGNLILKKKLPMLVGIQDLSTTEIEVELILDRKADINPELIMAYLFKHTRLQVSVKFDFTVLIPTDNPDVGAPERLDLKSILQHFNVFRFATVRRRLEFDLRKLLERIHILEGFEIIFDELDKAIRLIRQSDGRADAATRLMKAFSLDEIQTDAILDMRLYRLAKLEIEKIRTELAEKRKEAARIQGILKSKAKFANLVKSELETVMEALADRRRTRIGTDDLTEEYSAESFIVEEDAMVLVTRDGWVKRQRSINLETTRMREGDAPLNVVGGSTRECVIFLTNLGSAYVTRINDIPPSTGHGTPIQKLFKFKDGERVVAALGTDPRVMPEFAEPKPETEEGYEEPYPHVLTVTKQGYAQRFTLWPHRDPSTSRGRMFARLGKGDEVVGAISVYVENPVCAVTKKGKVLCAEAGDVNLLSGAGKGVIFIKLEDGDEVIAAFDAQAEVTLERSSGGSEKLVAKGREVTGRGGKGRPVIKRGTIKAVVLPLPEIPELNPDESAS